MHPFFHPTSVVLVDDDPEFLESFSFRFGDDWLCETFESPGNALSFMSQQEAHRQRLDRFWVPSKHMSDNLRNEFGDGIIGLKMSPVDRIITDSQRFSQISVAIIDYEMPTMTGFDLCRALNKMPMRKILLTGKVGRNEAVEAFNESLIDCFLEKSMPDLSSQLQRQVQRLQNEYFASTTEALCSLQVMGDAAFLKDPIFQLMFKKLSEKMEIIEYYAAIHPNGLLLGLQDGRFSFLRVSDEQDLQAHLEIAQINEAPNELLLRLEEGSDLPCFPTQSGFYEKSIQNIWHQHLFPAHVLHGPQTWRYSVISEEKIPKRILDNAISYHDYKHKQLH